MAFTREQLESYRGSTVPDLIDSDCRLLFVGINPGLWTAATQTHFCHPSNRFYPALRSAGLVDFKVDTSTGMTPDQRSSFTSSGMGITNLVERATVRASELGREELVQGGSRLKSFATEHQPSVVAVAGVTAFRTAFQRRDARVGKQDSRLSGAELWVVPNPSGLNAHATIGSLADWFLQVARAAGIK